MGRGISFPHLYITIRCSPFQTIWGACIGERCEPAASRQETPPPVATQQSAGHGCPKRRERAAEVLKERRGREERGDVRLETRVSAKLRRKEHTTDMLRKTAADTGALRSFARDTGGHSVSLRPFGRERRLRPAFTLQVSCKRRLSEKNSVTYLPYRGLFCAARPYREHFRAEPQHRASFCAAYPYCTRFCAGANLQARAEGFESTRWASKREGPRCRGP